MQRSLGVGHAAGQGKDVLGRGDASAEALGKAWPGLFQEWPGRPMVWDGRGTEAVREVKKGGQTMCHLDCEKDFSFLSRWDVSESYDKECLDVALGLWILSGCSARVLFKNELQNGQARSGEMNGTIAPEDTVLVCPERQ